MNLFIYNCRNHHLFGLSTGNNVIGGHESDAPQSLDVFLNVSARMWVISVQHTNNESYCCTLNRSCLQ